MKTIRPSTLVLDIGNSEIDYALINNGKIILSGAYPHAQWKVETLAASKLGKQKISHIYLGSVRPQKNRTVCRVSKTFWGIMPWVIQHPLPGNIIKIQYYPVKSLGMDRVANVLACRDVYPLPLMVIDFGTASTFTVLNQEGILLGGAISTGIQTAWETLLGKAEQLPLLKLEKKKNHPVIGNSTAGSLYSGFLHGFGAMADGMVEKVMAELETSDLTVIATGGLASLIQPYCRSIKKVDPHLTLKGYYLLGKLILNKG